MRKFLSLLLALTMVLSLVVVPANAQVVDASQKPATVTVSATGGSASVEAGKTLDVSATAGPQNATDIPDGYTKGSETWEWTSNSDTIATVSGSGSSATVTGVAAGTATITCKYSCTYSKDADNEITVAGEGTLSVAVTEASEEITYTFSATKVEVTADPTTVETSNSVSFTAEVTGATVTKHSSKADVEDTTLDTSKYELVYTWTGATASSSDAKTATQTFTTDEASEQKTVTCTVTAKLKGDNASETVTGSKQGSTTVTVTNTEVSNQNAANNAFAAALTQVTFKGRTYSISDGVKYLESEAGDLASGIEAVTPAGYTDVTTKGYNDGKLRVEGKKDNQTVTASVSLECKKVTPSVSISKPSGVTNKLEVGKEYTFSASLNNKVDSDTVTFAWQLNGTVIETNNSTVTIKPDETGTYTLKCIATYKETAYNSTLTLTAESNEYTLSADDSTLTYTVDVGKTVTIPAPTLKDKSGNAVRKSDITDWTWTSAATSIATVAIKGGTSATKYNGVVTGVKGGEAKITVSCKYNDKTYTLDYTVTVNGGITCTLDSTENGESVGYTYSELASAAKKAIKSATGDTVSVHSISVVASSSYGKFYKDSVVGKYEFTGSWLMADDTTLYFVPNDDFVGDVTFTMNVGIYGSGTTYVITATIPVSMQTAEFDGQTADADSDYYVSCPSGYDAYWVLGTSKPSDSAYESNDWSAHSGKYTGATNATSYKVSKSALADGSQTLYIVAIDDGVVYKGTLTVSTKAYTISYQVVAGSSVSFAQKDFDDLLEDMFKAQDTYSYRQYSTDFQHVKFSSVSSGKLTGNGWQLYEGSDKLAKTDKVTDLDKVSFEAGSKLSDTVKIGFTIYADVIKDSTGKVTESDVPFTGTVEITVVSEDIKYTVGINDSVTFDASDFQDYLRSETNSKKLTLDYVTFELGKNNAASFLSNGGALYRTANGKLASSSDKFYYSPSKTQLDLDDVTYSTSNYAVSGNVVYIPFTAYATTGSKSVTGTVAIEIKQTIKFTDVTSADYFYEPVMWAVNNNITNGTTTTTFSPKLGCTRAQIVTFLWRAAGSPNPSKSTCSFKDVTSKHSDYLKAIIWATEKGITDGTSATTFSPDATCTRAQIVTFLYRYAGKPATSGTVSFKDVSKTTHASYYNAIQWAVGKGITNGNGGNTFAPDQTCSRSDAVTFLYRARNILSLTGTTTK